jgi:hypothetical protein
VAATLASDAGFKFVKFLSSAVPATESAEEVVRVIKGAFAEACKHTVSVIVIDGIDFFLS